MFNFFETFLDAINSPKLNSAAILNIISHHKRQSSIIKTIEEGSKLDELDQLYRHVLLGFVCLKKPN